MSLNQLRLCSRRMLLFSVFIVMMVGLQSQARGSRPVPTGSAVLRSWAGEKDFVAHHLPLSTKQEALFASKNQTGFTRPSDEWLAAVHPAEGNTNRVSKDVYEGWKWWHSYCFRCHGPDATGGFAPDLRKSIKEKITEEMFIQIVRKGRPDKGMPAWEQVLKEGQIQQIYRYVLERAEGRLSAGKPARM